MTSWNILYLSDARSISTNHLVPASAGSLLPWIRLHCHDINICRKKMLELNKDTTCKLNICLEELLSNNVALCILNLGLTYIYKINNASNLHRCRTPQYQTLPLWWRMSSYLQIILGIYYISLYKLTYASHLSSFLSECYRWICILRQNNMARYVACETVIILYKEIHPYICVYIYYIM